jgi:hypothetical protein
MSRGSAQFCQAFPCGRRGDWAQQDGKGFNVKLDFLPPAGAEIVIPEPRAEGGRSLPTSPFEIRRLNDNFRRSLSGARAKRQSMILTALAALIWGQLHVSCRIVLLGLAVMGSPDRKLGIF